MTVTIDCMSVALSLGQPTFAYLPVFLLANEPWRGFKKHTHTAPMQICYAENTRFFKAQAGLSVFTFLLSKWNCDPAKPTVSGRSADLLYCTKTLNLLWVCLFLLEFFFFFFWQSFGNIWRALSVLMHMMWGHTPIPPINYFEWRTLLAPCAVAIVFC